MPLIGMHMRCMAKCTLIKANNYFVGPRFIISLPHHLTITHPHLAPDNFPIGNCGLSLYLDANGDQVTITIITPCNYVITKL